jgi:hypothetical protein
MSQWSRWTGWAVLMVAGALTPGTTVAAEFDGSVPMLCAVLDVIECDRGGGCESLDGADIGLPPFLRVDVGGKALEATDGSGRKTPIHSSTLVKEQERLLLLGDEQGRAWSVVIAQKTGAMTAAIVDHDGGFLVSGACTLP